MCLILLSFSAFLFLPLLSSSPSLLFSSPPTALPPLQNIYLIFLKKMKEHLFVRNKYQWSCALALQEERTKSDRTQIKMDKNKGFIKWLLAARRRKMVMLPVLFIYVNAALYTWIIKYYLFIQHRNLLILAKYSNYPWFFHCYIPQVNFWIWMYHYKITELMGTLEVFWVQLQPLPMTAIFILSQTNGLEPLFENL